MAVTFYYNSTKIQIFKIFSGIISETVQMHSHSKNGYEIHFIDYGRGTLNTEHSSYELTQNTLFITGPNVMHKQTPDFKMPMHELCVFFKISNQKQGSEAISAFASQSFWIGKGNSEIKELFYRMISENGADELYREDTLSSLAIKLICEISRLYSPNRIGAAKTNSNDLNENRSWILDELLLEDCSEATISGFAAKMGVSERQAERIIKDYYGSSFKKLRYEAKMAMAATLLEQNNLSVEKCALRCGYTSASAFIIAFKKKYNLTPTAYRSQFK